MADEDGHFRGETLDLLLHDLDDDILDPEFEEQIAVAVTEVGMGNEVNKLYAFFPVYHKILSLQLCLLSLCWMASSIQQSYLLICYT